MIYLDAAATTPVDEEVLNLYNKITTNYPGNVNSSHKLGLEAKAIYDDSLNTLSSLLNIPSNTITLTSGATESNTLAINGLIKAYPNRNKHIISTKTSHPSVTNLLNTLIDYKITYLELNKDGRVDLNQIKDLLMEKPLLVSIPYIDSELGIIEDIEGISKLMKESNTFFHLDATQAFNKINIDYTQADLISWSPHKYFGPKGIGYLYVRPNLNIKPIFPADNSLRGGTIPLPLVAASSLASIKAVKDRDKFSVVELNNIIIDKLSTYEDVVINNTVYSHPSFINISVLGIKSTTLVNAFSNNNICISARSACSGEKQYSYSVLALTNDKDRASSSIRITLSKTTTKEEINTFLQVFGKIYQDLKGDLT